ncbi:hypothetical protein L1049_008170 [Liquidambar formosana]|uniref:Uncharacterized protein n=1 Tax=Liquidambar formosana TaxID=63359 RepID=A0AAP0S3V7_LIQFO
MNILHLKGLTPNGLAAALLACGGLTKVKLQASFKSKLPHLLFQHLEARGCVFQWRDKVFQVFLFTCLKFYIAFLLLLLLLFGGWPNLVATYPTRWGDTCIHCLSCSLSNPLFPSII